MNSVLKPWFGWWWSSWLCFSGAHWLLLANVIGDEKLLHGHPVHGGEPLHDLSGALVLVRVTVVLLQVDGELSDFHVIEEILCHKIQASLALLTGVPWCLAPDPADAHQLADVGGTIDDKMVDDGKNHLGIVFCHVVGTIIALSCGAKLLNQVLSDIRGVRLHIPSKVVHLIDAFGTGELWPCALGGGTARTKKRARTFILV